MLPFPRCVLEDVSRRGRRRRLRSSPPKSDRVAVLLSQIKTSAAWWLRKERIAYENACEPPEFMRTLDGKVSSIASLSTDEQETIKIETTSMASSVEIDACATRCLDDFSSSESDYDSGAESTDSEPARDFAQSIVTETFDSLRTDNKSEYEELGHGSFLTKKEHPTSIDYGWNFPFAIPLVKALFTELCHPLMQVITASSLRAALSRYSLNEMKLAVKMMSKSVESSVNEHEFISFLAPSGVQWEANKEVSSRDERIVDKMLEAHAKSEKAAATAALQWCAVYLVRLALQRMMRGAALEGKVFDARFGIEQRADCLDDEEMPALSCTALRRFVEEDLYLHLSDNQGSALIQFLDPLAKGRMSTEHVHAMIACNTRMHYFEKSRRNEMARTLPGSYAHTYESLGEFISRIQKRRFDEGLDELEFTSNNETTISMNATQAEAKDDDPSWWDGKENDGVETDDENASLDSLSSEEQSSGDESSEDSSSDVNEKGRKSRGTIRIYSASIERHPLFRRRARILSLAACKPRAKLRLGFHIGPWKTSYMSVTNDKPEEARHSYKVQWDDDLDISMSIPRRQLPIGKRGPQICLSLWKGGRWKNPSGGSWIPDKTSRLVAAGTLHISELSESCEVCLKPAQGGRSTFDEIISSDVKTEDCLLCQLSLRLDGDKW